MGKLGKSLCRVEKGFTMSTHLGENIDVDHLYKGVRPNLKRVWDECRSNTFIITWFWYYSLYGLVE